METYKIIRFFEDGRKRIENTGLTLEQAQEHCRLESTHGKTRAGVRFFDGYDAE